jgi:hypothetical protein
MDAYGTSSHVFHIKILKNIDLYVFSFKLFATPSLREILGRPALLDKIIYDFSTDMQNQK